MPKSTTKYYICDAARFATSVLPVEPNATLADAHKANKQQDGETMVVGVPALAISAKVPVRTVKVEARNFEGKK